MKYQRGNHVVHPVTSSLPVGTDVQYMARFGLICHAIYTYLWEIRRYQICSTVSADALKLLQVISTFEQFDTDSNGLISREELKAVLQRRGHMT